MKFVVQARKVISDWSAGGNSASKFLLVEGDGPPAAWRHRLAR
jgi:hypothetical protein